MTARQTNTKRTRRNGSPAPWGSLTIADDLMLSTIGETQFSAMVLAEGIPHISELRWATPSSSLDPVLPHALTTTRSAQAQSALLELAALFGDRALALVTLRGDMVHARLAAPEQAVVSDMEAWLHERFPVVSAGDAQEVPVRFWSCGFHGAASAARTIAVPTWSEIRGNYPRTVQERLGRLMSPSFRPAQGGQLILWSGPPGTGKTYALRALGWEWREWCDLHYVLDPEILFGQRADYMLEVLLDEEHLFGLGHGKRDTARKWRLLVLEDTGELLAADAKERTGQGLSRLLNLVDGIVGQGLRVLVLVTTNEALRQLHPAVARPGRCAARVGFEPLPPSEAAAWLAERGADQPGDGTATLATLFAQIEDREIEPERQIGFGR